MELYDYFMTSFMFQEKYGIEIFGEAIERLLKRQQRNKECGFLQTLNVG